MKMMLSDWFFFVACIAVRGTALRMKCSNGFKYRSTAHLAISRLTINKNPLNEASLKVFERAFDGIASLAELPEEGNFDLHCFSDNNDNKHMRCKRANFEKHLREPGVQMQIGAHAEGLGFLDVDNEEENRNGGVFFVDIEPEELLTTNFTNGLLKYEVLPLFMVPDEGMKIKFEETMIKKQLCGKVLSLKSDHLNSGIPEVMRDMFCHCQAPNVVVTRRLDVEGSTVFHEEDVSSNNGTFVNSLSPFAQEDVASQNVDEVDAYLHQSWGSWLLTPFKVSLAKIHEMMNRTNATTDPTHSPQRQLHEKRNLRKVIRNKINIKLDVCGCCGRVDCSCCNTAAPMSTIPKTTWSDVTVSVGKTIPKECRDNFALEFYYTQDNTKSFENDIENMKDLLPKLFNALDAAFYNGFEAGFGTFADKPAKPFGYATDYCFYQHLPLTRNFDAIYKEMNELQIHSGRDWKESQLVVLQHVALSPASEWSRRGGVHPVSGKKILKILALSTDSGFHQAGDAALHGYDWPANNGDAHIDCDGEDYPSVNQVQRALRAKEIYPLFLIQDNINVLYENLVTELDLPGIVESVSEDSKNVIDSIIEGINKICEDMM